MTSYTVPEAFIASQRCGRRQQCQRDADRIAALEAENKLYEDALANYEQRCGELEAKRDRLLRLLKNLLEDYDEVFKWLNDDRTSIGCVPIEEYQSATEARAALGGRG